MVVLTIITVTVAGNVTMIGGECELPDNLPALFLPVVPLNLQTFTTIPPYVPRLAMVAFARRVAHLVPVT